MRKTEFPFQYVYSKISAKIRENSDEILPRGVGRKFRLSDREGVLEKSPLLSVVSSGAAMMYSMYA